MRLGVRGFWLDGKSNFPRGPKIAGRFHADGWRSRSPFGDLAKCTTAAGADAGVNVQFANLFTWGWGARHRGLEPTAQVSMLAGQIGGCQLSPQAAPQAIARR